MKSFPFASRPELLRKLLVVVPAFALAAASGCTSALTTASLRGLPWDLADTHAETAEEPDTVAAENTAEDAEPESEEVAEDAAEDHDTRRAAAIEEAINRLSKVGSLDEQTQLALVTTLQTTQPEDWPVVIAEFAAALTKPAVPAASTHVVAKAELSPSAPPPAPAPEPAASAPVETPAAEQPAEPVVATPDEPATAPEPAPPARESVPAVSIRTACFASRVQAWGVFDRFPADRFTPGQEVIVYVELDDLAASTAADGHTTCIDAVLRLVAADGRTIEEWNFEPIAETCANRRRDYFARFVIRIPESAAAGRSHVAVSVTDTLAGKTVETTLPLEVAAD
jgi:hypothetical protein